MLFFTRVRVRWDSPLSLGHLRRNVQVGDSEGKAPGRGRWARSAQGAEAEAEATVTRPAEADRIGDVVSSHPDELGPDVRTDEEQAVLTAVALADGHREVPPTMGMHTGACVSSALTRLERWA